MKKLLVSVFLLLFVSVVHAKDYSLGQWEWDAVTGTDSNGDGIPDQGVPTGYRIYYTVPSCCNPATSFCTWPTTQMVDIPADVNHCGLLHCHSANACCGDFPVMPTPSVTFIIITAYNAVGESSTEHGTVVPTCP